MLFLLVKRKNLVAFLTRPEKKSKLWSNLAFNLFFFWNNRHVKNLPSFREKNKVWKIYWISHSKWLRSLQIKWQYVQKHIVKGYAVLDESIHKAHSKNANPIKPSLKLYCNNNKKCAINPGEQILLLPSDRCHRDGWVDAIETILSLKLLVWIIRWSRGCWKRGEPRNPLTLLLLSGCRSGRYGVVERCLVYRTRRL